MPTFSDKLTPEEIDLMARFIISLKKTEPTAQTGH